MESSELDPSQGSLGHSQEPSDHSQDSTATSQGSQGSSYSPSKSEDKPDSLEFFSRSQKKDETNSKLKYIQWIIYINGSTPLVRL